MAEVRPNALVVTAEWTFRRRDDRLIVRRERQGDAEVWLSVIEGSTTRRYRFEELHRLIAFQSDMESFLVRTGWLLEAFAPERRTGRDRRTLPRADNDRRRWWTDGQVSSLKSQPAAIDKLER